ncbi:NAD/NADP-dependent betaine aldehyde dehydrogenase (fragment) [Parafrankia sp. Ea1.12]
MHPTVLTNVSTDARLYREEIFGPVVAVLPFDDEDEAIALANDTTYGLAGAVYTQNGARAHRLAKRIEAGTITLNCQLVFDHQMPFGGYKQSGWGREFGKDGIEMYLQTKSVYNQL